MIKLLKGIRADIDFESCNTLVDKKILSSLDIIQIISEVEDEFDVEIPAEEINPDNFNSADAMLAMIDRLKR